MVENSGLILAGIESRGQNAGDYGEYHVDYFRGI